MLKIFLKTIFFSLFLVDPYSALPSYFDRNGAGSHFAHEPKPLQIQKIQIPLNPYDDSSSTTTERPSSTHPMDNPDWEAPLGPEEERKPEFWHKNGQDYLSHRLNLKEPNKNKAKNVIIFIGDGMSLATQMATRVFMGNENKYLSFEKFPYTGLSRTYAPNYQVPDSANTATAILTGVKTNYGTVGVTGEVRLKDCTAAQKKENQLKTILKWGQEKNKWTGFVTTTRVTHATPSSCYAKSPDREFENDVVTPEGCIDIASQLINGDTGKNFHVQMGGGSGEFYTIKETIHGKAGKREDKNLIDEWKKLKNESSYDFVTNRDQLLKVDSSKTDYLFGLFHHSHMSYHLAADTKEEPSLMEMVSKALEILSKSEDGFVLLVEGGMIDQAHHGNYAQMALDETVELSKAIEYARNKTSEEDTLIVVTADHSHTFTIGGYPVRGNNILDIGDFSRNDSLPFLTLSYANGRSYQQYYKEDGGRYNPDDMDTHDIWFQFPSPVPYEDETHGGEDVGVYASGPWSHLFVGNYEQSYIFHAMMYASSLDGETFKRPDMYNGAGPLSMTFVLILSITMTVKSILS